MANERHAGASFGKTTPDEQNDMITS